jgi:hypothetical protein
MHRVELSLVMNAERSVRKLLLCMRLTRKTQRFGTLPDVHTFECRGCGVSRFEDMSAQNQRCVDRKCQRKSFSSLQSRRIRNDTALGRRDWRRLNCGHLS